MSKFDKHQKQDKEWEDAQQTTYLTDKELEYFRQLLLKKRAQALENIERFSNILGEELETASSEYSYHIADAGTDAMEREMAYLIISREKKYIGYIDQALKRIDDRTYGICKITGKPIPKERLEVVPTTEVSVEGKLQASELRRIKLEGDVEPTKPWPKKEQED